MYERKIGPIKWKEKIPIDLPPVLPLMLSPGHYTTNAIHFGSFAHEKHLIQLTPALLSNNIWLGLLFPFTTLFKPPLFDDYLW